MASSPLTAALLAQSGMVMPPDPATQAALARLGIFQNLANEATSTAPAYPLQGLARAVQGVVGGYGLNKGFQALTNVYGGNTAEDMANSLPEGHPLRTALGSKNPMVRFYAMQEYGKALTQMGEPQKTAGGQSITYGTPGTNTSAQSPEGKLATDLQNANQNSPNVAAAVPALTGALAKSGTEGGISIGASPSGQPTAAPVAGYTPAKAQQEATVAAATDTAKVLPDVARAVATKAGELPYTITEGRPGSAFMPATAAFTGPGVPPLPDYVQGMLHAPLKGTTTPSLQPPVPPTASPQGATTPTPSTSAAPSPAAAPSPEDSMVRRLPTGGVQVPNAEVFHPLIEKDTAEVERDRETAIQGQRDQATLQEVKDLIDQGTTTNWSVPMKLEAARILKAGGVPQKNLDDFMGTDVGNTQALNKLFLQNSATAVRAMGAREPGSVIHLFGEAYQNIGTDPDAVKLMTNTQFMDRQMQNELSTEKTNFLNQSVNDLQKTNTYRGLKGFNEEFKANHDPQLYLRAAEAMSGPKYAPWDKVTDEPTQRKILSLIPSGQQFTAPDGQTYVRH